MYVVCANELPVCRHAYLMYSLVLTVLTLFIRMYNTLNDIVLGDDNEHKLDVKVMNRIVWEHMPQ